MVERVWLARAANRDNAVAYASYFRRIVLPELKAVTGYRGAKVLQRDCHDGLEIVVVSRWESLDAVRGFAGDDIDRAVVQTGGHAVKGDVRREENGRLLYFDGRCWTHKPPTPQDVPF